MMQAFDNGSPGGAIPADRPSLAVRLAAIAAAVLLAVMAWRVLRDVCTGLFVCGTLLVAHWYQDGREAPAATVPAAERPAVRRNGDDATAPGRASTDASPWLLSV